MSTLLYDMIECYKDCVRNPNKDVKKESDLDFQKWTNDMFKL